MTFENDQDTGAIEQFDFAVDLLRALLWQYNDAENLQAILEAKDAWYVENQQQFWEDWFTNVFNLETANDFGLNVWSIILGQPIYINNGPQPQGQIFGLGEFNQNLTNGNFGSQNGYSYQFSTPYARLLLQLRYFQLTSAGTVPEINRMLKYLFGSNYGPAFLVDDHDMTQRYLFGFTIPSEMLLMFNSFDILPRPAGVKSTMQQESIVPFGLGPYNGNLLNSNFSNG